MADEIKRWNAGWAASCTGSDIADALRAALHARMELTQRGSQARALVEANYTWEKVAAQTIEHYHELIQGHQLKVQ